MHHGARGVVDTYGEFTIDQVDPGNRATYKLHFVDSTRYLLKSLAIRRTLNLLYGHLPLRNANLRCAGFSREDLYGTLLASTNQDMPCITISSQPGPSTVLS